MFDYMKYISKIIVTDTEKQFIKKIGIRFIFSEAFSANLVFLYNTSLGIFYDFKVQKFLYYAEGPEIECKNFTEVNNILEKCCKSSNKEAVLC